MFKEVIALIDTDLEDPVKVLLAITYDEAKLTFNTQTDDFKPVLTVLIFNFIVNPRNQAAFKISPADYPLVKDFNRIMLNCAFNQLFKIDDELKYFNPIISECNAVLKSTMEDMILSLPSNLSSLVLNYFETYIYQTPFLFYFDAACLIDALTSRELLKFDSREEKHRKSLKRKRFVLY